MTKKYHRYFSQLLGKKWKDFIVGIFKRCVWGECKVVKVRTAVVELFAFT